MPYCPECQAEYVEGVEVCPDCLDRNGREVPLVAHLPDEPDPPDPTTEPAEPPSGEEFQPGELTRPFRSWWNSWKTRREAHRKTEGETRNDVGRKVRINYQKRAPSILALDIAAVVSLTVAIIGYVDAATRNVNGINVGILAGLNASIYLLMAIIAFGFSTVARMMLKIRDEFSPDSQSEDNSVRRAEEPE